MGSAGMEVRDELILGIECVLHEAEVADEEVEEIESRDSRRVLVGRCWEGRLGNAIWIGSVCVFAHQKTSYKKWYRFETHHLIPGYCPQG